MKLLHPGLGEERVEDLDGGFALGGREFLQLLEAAPQARIAGAAGALRG
jgi:hypothetical protein